MFELAQAPIAPGSGRCVRLADGGCVERLEGLPLGSGNVSFVVDVQLEGSGRHPVLRHEESGRVIGLDLDRQADATTAHVWLGLEPEWFKGTVVLSATTGKRLALRLRVAERVALIDELQPWGPASARAVPLPSNGALVRNWRGFRVGGSSGEVAGSSFRGRLAEVRAYSRLLDDATIERLRQASAARYPVDVPDFKPGVLNDEGREVFLADYGQLVRWHNSGSLNTREVREAASLAHLWLLDRYPLLQRVADHYGAMLSFPDLRRAKALAEKVEEDRPALWWPQDEHAGDWVSLSAFRNDLACWLGKSDHPVTWAAFIKFVRNKLGGGHYDPEDRLQWQRELNELARETRVRGDPWLAMMMSTLVRSLILAADGSGLAALARIGC